MPEQWNAERLLETGAAFQLSRILLTAAELDLFTKLKGRFRTVEDLCATEGWHPRGVRILMDALAAQGLLTRTADGRYTVEESVVEFLTHDEDKTVLPMILHRVRMWNSWSHITEIVRTGNSPYYSTKESRSKEDMEAFIGAMHVIGRGRAGEIARSVDLTRFRRVLDVGGATGTYAVAFLKAAPHMTATVFDLPLVIEMARKKLTDEGYIDRVELVAGDYMKDDLPAGHDLALLSAIIHSNSREVNRELFRKIHECLEPAGVILIRDFVMDMTRTHPAEGAIFAVNMLAATTGGDCFTFQEIREDLEQAGFRGVRMTREGQHMDQLIEGVK
ncbi:MAG: methyltransferase domain-containing protein [Desulfomonile tiedjei]|nr:methyltransferase domain-containing protein [Desulfomonile tiedjei]